MRNPEAQYEKRKNYYYKLIQKQTKRIDLISNLRLAVFLLGTVSVIILFILKYFILLAACLVIFLFSFTWLIVKHNKYIQNKAYSSLLHEINNNSLKRLKGEWNQFLDRGEEFADDDHNYSKDLDIFGNNSLFQWINTANTFKGRQMLKNLFTDNPKSSDEIAKQQEAVEEVALKLGWRQRFHAESLSASHETGNPDYLISWANEHNKTFCNKWLIAVIRISPAVTAILLLLAWKTSIIPWFIPTIALLLQFAALRINKNERYKLFSMAEKYSSDIRVYYRMLKLFETHKFQSEYICEFKKSMHNHKGIPAYKQIDRLSKIIDSISSRHGPFYILLNILTLWDYQNMVSLEQWRTESGQLLHAWLDAVGKIEAISSLSIIRYDNPGWVMPKIIGTDGPCFEAEDMGHPLININRVNNNLFINNLQKALIITGSNMSGKSTLLRTAGINLVLAYTGAPVCAKKFNSAIMEIHTCMRVSDDISKSISSFYAELLRIKAIVKEAETGKSIFFLLDEIFKGTNSRDRHTGARVLIQKLSGLNCIGMVSTHDIELGDLEKDSLKIKNYHFEEYYRDDRIYFDFILRPGVSTTRNAVYLMKMAGIEISD